MKQKIDRREDGRSEPIPKLAAKRNSKAQRAALIEDRDHLNAKRKMMIAWNRFDVVTFVKDGAPDHKRALIL